MHIWQKAYCALGASQVALAVKNPLAKLVYTKSMSVSSIIIYIWSEITVELHFLSLKFQGEDLYSYPPHEKQGDLQEIFFWAIVECF